MAPITIHGNTLDPADTSPETKAKLVPELPKTSYIIVQLSGKLEPAHFKSLQESQVLLQEKIDGLTWLCRHNTFSPADIKKLTFAKYIIPYAPFFKVGAQLKAVRKFVSYYPGLGYHIRCHDPPPPSKQIH